jgi:hypothetical protein
VKLSIDAGENALLASLIVMPIVSRPMSSGGRKFRILWCFSPLSHGGSVSVMCVHSQGVLLALHLAQTSSNFCTSNSALPSGSLMSISLV